MAVQGGPVKYRDFLWGSFNRHPGIPLDKLNQDYHSFMNIFDGRIEFFCLNNV